MQIPIVNGIYADGAPDLRTSYPRNLVPVPKVSGIASGYLRQAEGLVAVGSGPGTSRGGINWNGTLYRVMGDQLVSISETGAAISVGGGIAGTDNCRMVYSFDYLAIAGGGRLYLYDGAALRAVTDTDLGTVLDVTWQGGYFITTDGSNLVVTELTDPFSVNPLKYGSSEVDPDPVVALLKLRNEIYALNKHTIETFTNVGGDFFPFQPVSGATIPKGCVGTHAAAVFADAIAFVGGSADDGIGVWLGLNGTAQRISTAEVETVLKEYTSEQHAEIALETRTDRVNEQLWLRLPDRTIVYDHAASQALGSAVWYTLTTSITGFAEHRARDVVFCYNQWNVGDTISAQFGVMDSSVSTHWGNVNGWEFGTAIVYNEGRGALFHELELIALTGNVNVSVEPVVWTQYSLDGETWSMERPAKVGKTGNRDKRIAWFGNGTMRTRRMQRFRGTSDAHIAPIRLEGRLEPLAY